MIDNKYIELMNKEIDNVITSDEKIKLHEYLSSNAAAKEYFNELLLTNQYLDELPDRNPSENLKKQILNSINFDKYSPKIKSKFSWRYIFSPKLKLAYTFAVGLIAGLIIYGVINNYTNNSLNVDDAYGTIGLENKNTTVLENLSLNYDELAGKIEVTNQGDNFWLNVDLNSAQKFNLLVTYPDNIKFESIQPEPSSIFNCAIDKNIIKTSDSGKQYYRLLFSQNRLSSAVLNVKITQLGKIIYDHNLKLER
jgi:hypothetical protein